MSPQETKWLKLIVQLRNLPILQEEVKEINKLEAKMILDLIPLSRPDTDFLNYLADKYHENLK